VFFIFQSLALDDYELCFMIYFGLLFMRLSRFYDSGYVFCGLTQVDLSRFIVSWFYIDFFSISNF
jgi:hypothetical protein